VAGWLGGCLPDCLPTCLPAWLVRASLACWTHLPAAALASRVKLQAARGCVPLPSWELHHALLLALAEMPGKERHEQAGKQGRLSSQPPASWLGGGGTSQPGVARAPAANASGASSRLGALPHAAGPSSLWLRGAARAPAGKAAAASQAHKPFSTAPGGVASASSCACMLAGDRALAARWAQLPAPWWSSTATLAGRAASRTSQLGTWHSKKLALLLGYHMPAACLLFACQPAASS